MVAELFFVKTNRWILKPVAGINDFAVSAVCGTRQNTSPGDFSFSWGKKISQHCLHSKIFLSTVLVPRSGTFCSRKIEHQSKSFARGRVFIVFRHSVPGPDVGVRQIGCDSNSSAFEG